MLSVNIAGVANVIRAFVPAMVERGSGTIVNLSSGWGRSVAPEVAPYCATKWAIEGLTKALAAELPGGHGRRGRSTPASSTRTCCASASPDSASSYPEGRTTGPKTAAPFILGLGPRDNGKSASVGGFED